LKVGSEQLLEFLIIKGKQNI
jgi:hypothetical protein